MQKCKKLVFGLNYLYNNSQEYSYLSSTLNTYRLQCLQAQMKQPLVSMCSGIERAFDAISNITRFVWSWCIVVWWWCSAVKVFAPYCRTIPHGCVFSISFLLTILSCLSWVVDFGAPFTSVAIFLNTSKISGSNREMMLETCSYVLGICKHLCALLKCANVSLFQSGCQPTQGTPIVYEYTTPKI